MNRLLIVELVTEIVYLPIDNILFFEFTKGEKSQLEIYLKGSTRQCLTFDNSRTYKPFINPASTSSLQVLTETISAFLCASTSTIQRLKMDSSVAYYPSYKEVDE